MRPSGCRVPSSITCGAIPIRTTSTLPSCEELEDVLHLPEVNWKGDIITSRG